MFESDKEIISRRVIDAPRDKVFKAWSDPKHLAKWWGPKGFRNTFSKFDFRIGGTWKFVMHGPNGIDYSNESVFVEIQKPERIVLDHLSPPKFRITATFKDLEGKTQLTFKMSFETAKECENIKKIAVPSNEENFDRLETELSFV